MKKDTIRVTAIGHIAHQVLNRNRLAFVRGVASGGVYLQPDHDLTLYLTPDLNRGPLTVNIRDLEHRYRSIQDQELVFLLRNEILFTESGVSYAIYKPLIWKSRQLSHWNNPEQSRIIGFARRVSNQYPEHPYVHLLGIDLPVNNTPDIPGSLPLERLKQDVRDWKKGNFQDKTIWQTDFLFTEIQGLGPGLTPLGDDVLLGVLLTINRLKGIIPDQRILEQINLQVLNAAPFRTTSLSCSLLSCAVQGYADERILRVLDSLGASREIPDRDVDELLSWGSSSGMAVLAGILLVLTA
jgi:hypothetical protein